MIEHIDFSSHTHNGEEQCRRLFHGRGGHYPGLEHICIDWLPPVTLITVYKEEEPGWLLQQAQALLDKLPGCRSVQVQFRCRPKAPTEVVLGETIHDLVADEIGLKFHIQLGRSQNNGLFLDMHNGLQWVRQHTAGRRVLNLFAYTCGFSAAAIDGGADFVLNVDMSKAALSRGRENHRLNQQDTTRVGFQGVDIFKSFSRLKKYGPYDLLISAPPAFQKGSVDIRRDYKKIIRRLPELMNPGGQLLLCLNSPTLTESFLHELMEMECPACRFEKAIPPPAVYREAEAGKGLKVLLFSYHGSSSQEEEQCPD